MTERGVARLPLGFVELFESSGLESRCDRLGAALVAGLKGEAQIEEPTGPAERNAEGRRARAIQALRYYFTRHWYLAVSISNLRVEIAELEHEIDVLEKLA